ncbi:peptidase S15 [Mangrovactinospora gilvigrisea]|uniref:Peptidase S15 n=1 Tax=Mangrovactinospora gilvigrisea TaxID=1428644 RepID=A0A1J7BYP0_9ACTN|nr:CocE/NonD family hydrolase [Mangrovactinospora gilvigrisea]OIV38585.1 peptidase S15 [Mangrovactinospora gilvigrisea]
MRYRTDLPHPTTVEDTWIPLPDGTRLYARIWRPVTEEPVPVLLEYLPYRLGDWTAPRDQQRHPYYAGHGYASVRVDVRGAGNSDGVETDEYSAQELADGVEVVNWLAAQPWSTGRVGMFGISWGGFNSLQIAGLAPEPLKAIVTVCSTDDRYDNDVHYTGGSVLAVDMHAWAATMLAFTARPPDPAAVGDRWKRMWLDRLEQHEPFLHTWLAHQTRDDYWKHGSVCEDYGSIKAAVLAVGGWHDPYRDTVFRLLEHLGAPCHGLVGPWSHQYPDRGLPPGPSIGFLQETLRWWDRWLKDDTSTGVEKDPKLRAYISDPLPPATVWETRPGRWVGASSWPSPDVAITAYGLGGSVAADGELHPLDAVDGDGFVAVDSPQQTGVDAGRFFPFGNKSDLPPDQREEDGRSACFDSAPLGARVEILGRAKVRLRLRCDARRGQVVARLCDVAPDGSSTLVTRGVLNLSARRGRDRVTEWEPGAVEEVEFELNAVGAAFPPGHRIRLAVSNAYWPWVWPQADSGVLGVDPLASLVELPVRDPAADAGYPPIAFGEPEQTPPLEVAYGTPEEPRPERRVVRDVAEGEWLLEVDPNYGGSRTYPDGLVFTEEALERYWITEGDPLSARTRSDWFVRLERGEGADRWDASLRTRSEIRCDGERFLTFNSVTCWDGTEVVFDRTWEREIPRTAG